MPGLNVYCTHDVISLTLENIKGSFISKLMKAWDFV